MKEVMELDSESITDEDLHMDPLQLFNDNLGTTQTLNNPESTSPRSKHIGTRYFRTRDFIREQKLRVGYIGTDFNVADFFTKALKSPKFHTFRRTLGMKDVCRGGG